MKHRMQITGIVLLLTLALAGVAFAQEQEEGEADKVTGAEAATVLAPLAAAALGIERLLETGWGILETVFAKVNRFRSIRMTEAQLASDDTAKKEKDAYVRGKTWTSAAVGIGMGIAVAFGGKLRMFDLIGLEVVDGWDKFITGMVIGSGSKFTHDVIGIFSETKKLIERLQQRGSNSAG